MSFNVSEFRSNLVGDGARPNLFSVTLVFPTFVNNATIAGQKTTFMAKSAQLPGSSTGVVPMYYFGREELGLFQNQEAQLRFKGYPSLQAAEQLPDNVDADPWTNSVAPA